jgi:hypothetical protein
MEAARRDQEQVVNSAVEQSNRHSDQKIGEVKNNLEATKTDLGGRIDKLPNLISKSESDLSSTINNIAVPPVKQAKLQFSFFSPNTSKMPIVSQELYPDENGVFSLEFGVTNISDTVAANGEIWIFVCDQCLFAEDPQGFDKPEGSLAATRHTKFQILNPGVSVDIKVKVKLVGGPYRFFVVGMRYSCALCGKLQDVQSVKITVLPSLSPSKMN